MIILDTNVISALMQSQPDPQVIAWLDAQPAQSIWTTSVCVFEIHYGLNILPTSKKKQRLQRAFEQSLEHDFEGRILNFDQDAAQQAARISAQLRVAGHPVEIRDIQIAGITSAQHGTLATRNIKHFSNAGIPLINPWDSTPKAR